MDDPRISHLSRCIHTLLNLPSLTDLEQLEILVRFLQDASLSSIKVSFFNERLTCLHVEDECLGEVVYLYKHDFNPITIDNLSNQIFLTKGSSRSPLSTFNQALNHVFLPQIKDKDLIKLLTELGLMLAESSQNSQTHSLVSPLEDINSWQRDTSDESQSIRTILAPI